MVDCCDIDGCQYYGDSISTICPDHMKQFIDQQAEIARLEAELAEANKRVDYYKKQAGEFNQAYSRVQKELTELEGSRCANYDHISASLDTANGLLRELEWDTTYSCYPHCSSCGSERINKDGIVGHDDGCRLAAHLAGQPVDLPPSLRERCSTLLDEWQCTISRILEFEDGEIDGADSKALQSYMVQSKALIRELEQPVEDK